MPVPLRRRASSSLLNGSMMKNIAPDEAELINAVELGDLPSIRSILENEEDKERLIICMDYRERTPLEIATENEHFDIVEFIITEFAQLINFQVVHECVMLAISKGYVRITEKLLEHPLYQRSRGTINRLGTITNYFQQDSNSKFDLGVTPLMLASHCNEIDIIRLLLKKGETIKKPHHSACDCQSCKNRRKFDPLKYSKAAIFAYKALASPAYISLTCDDPILTAFTLGNELLELSRTEKEFKNEYKELVGQCRKYASDLLDMCQNTREVSKLLNKESAAHDVDLHNLIIPSILCTENESDSNNENRLSRLKLAIKYEQKQFVAHPHCQHHLATIWYESFPNYRRMPFSLKVLMSIIVFFTYPVLSLCYLIFPKSKVGRLISSPLVKFMMQTTSCVWLLLFLFLQSITASYYNKSSSSQAKMSFYNKIEKLPGNEVNKCTEFFRCFGEFQYRVKEMSEIEIIIYTFIAGLLWAEIKQVWNEGLHIYFSSGWNWIDITMLNFYIGSFVVKMFAFHEINESIAFFFEPRHPCSALLNGTHPIMNNLIYIVNDRDGWKESDPIFISEGLFALANLLNFFRLSFILPISEFLGPLQISLGRMLTDIIRFGAVFCVVFLAFFCSFLNLYWSYGLNSSFGTFTSTLATLFWSLFGLGEADETTLNKDENMSSYQVTQTIGTFLFAIYHVVMALVLLNMLIAMMSNSFQEIENDEDVEWKFARAKLWISYFEKGATLPVPFNIIPSPKTFWYIFTWTKNNVLHKFAKRTLQRELHFHGGRRKRTGEIIIVANRNVTRIEDTHVNITKAILKRYLFQLQREKENDEVNEGELAEIKNDISSLRFELTEKILKGSSLASQEFSRQSSSDNRKDASASSPTTETAVFRSPRRGPLSPKVDQSQAFPPSAPARVRKVNSSLTSIPEAKMLDQPIIDHISNLESKVEDVGKQIELLRKEILERISGSNLSKNEDLHEEFV